MLQHTVPESRGFGTAELLSYGRCPDFVWLISPGVINDLTNKIYLISSADCVEWGPIDHVSLELVYKCKISGIGRHIYSSLPYPCTEYMIKMDLILDDNLIIPYSSIPYLNSVVLSEKLIQHYAKRLGRIHCLEICRNFGLTNFRALMKVIELNERVYTRISDSTNQEAFQACLDFEARVGWKPE